jgi:hypothetical protein
MSKSTALLRGKLRPMFRSITYLLAAGVLYVGIAVAQEAEVYSVDAAGSDIHWRVYKAGTFSRFGHNHVISAGALSGTVTRQAEVSRSTFDLSIPVAALVVDDPQLRRLYGPDFSSEPTENDIAGTHTNMLSERVLDGEHYSELRIQGRIVSGEPEAVMFAITIDLLGRSIELTVPGSIVFNGDTLVASGEFGITHSDLGLEPFSVMMGALAVGQPLDFVYRVRAVKAE